MRRVPALALAALAILVSCGRPRDDVPSDPVAARGMTLSRSLACAPCHSVDGSGNAGPTWKGLHGSTVELDDGSSVVADDAYLAESIRDPDAKTVKGFPRGVMAAAIKPGKVPPDQVDAIVAYIRTLKNPA